jgi:hypothetical protein
MLTPKYQSNPNDPTRATTGTPPRWNLRARLLFTISRFFRSNFKIVGRSQGDAGFAQLAGTSAARAQLRRRRWLAPRTGAPSAASSCGALHGPRRRQLLSAASLPLRRWIRSWLTFPMPLWWWPWQHGASPASGRGMAIPRGRCSPATTVAVTHLPFINSVGAPSPLHRRGRAVVGSRRRLRSPSPWWHLRPHGGGASGFTLCASMIVLGTACSAALILGKAVQQPYRLFLPNFILNC